MRAIATDVTQRGLPASVCVLATRVNFTRKWQFYGTGVYERDQTCIIPKALQYQVVNEWSVIRSVWQ